MAVNPYDRAAWSTFTPLSSQEILQPAMIMQERQNQLDSEYAAINDEMQQIEFIAATENDPLIQQMYSNYQDNLNSAMDMISERGVTPGARRKMLGIKSQFNSQIAPIKQGYELKQQDINQYNQLKMKDPTHIGPDPSMRSVSDYMANGLQPFSAQGISGALLTKMSADQYSQYSKVLRDKNPEEVKALLTDMFGEVGIPQYYNLIMRKGYNPNDPEFAEIKTAIESNILNSMGDISWMDQNQFSQAMGYIKQGESHAIGQDDMRILDNKSYGSYAKMIEMQNNTRKLPADMLALSYKNTQIKKNFETYQDQNKHITDVYKGFKESGKTNFNEYVNSKDYYKIVGETSGGVNKEAMDQAIKYYDQFGGDLDDIDNALKNNPVYSEFTFTTGTSTSGAVQQGKLRENVNDTVLEYVDAIRTANAYKGLVEHLSEIKNIPTREAERLANSYMESTSQIFSNIYRAGSASSSPGEAEMNNAIKENMFNTESATIYKNGDKVKNHKIKNSIKRDIINGGKVLGHNPYDPDSRQSTLVVEYTTGKEGDKKGDKYVVEVPDANIGYMYQDTKKIYEKLRESMTFLPQEIQLSTNHIAKLYSEPTNNG